ncbi:MAG: alpha/beta fold hydrolase [Myxococcota bacterium]
MSPVSQAVATDDGLKLRLRRLDPIGRGTPKSSVLLLHGANTNGDSFFVPGGGLAAWLAQQGHIAWVLDWRGSTEIVDRFQSSHHERFDFDHVAANDVSAALRAIKDACPDARVSIVGHCMGGASTAMALGSGRLEPFDIRHVVFIAAGLFLSGPIESQLRMNDGMLENAIAEDPSHPGADPKRLEDWPEQLRRMAELWPRSSLPQGESSGDLVFQRASIMYGRPYRKGLVPPDVHERAGELFGLLHLGLARHSAQCMRRGYVAPLDAPETGAQAWTAAQPYFQSNRFRGREIALITGRHNALWHPDSLGRFGEWLRSEAGTKPSRTVLPDYAHQDLLWGRDAHRDVFPLVQRALPQARWP